MNRLSAAGAAGIYTIAALAFTWPLASSLTSSLPWDMGDPVLNTWILGWGADRLQELLAGDLGAFARYWNAGIFHPSPLTLAYSEHLFAQALLVWPVDAVTGNPVLCYNLVFLSTYVLSGLGMFLLVRDITGSASAAFVAGLFFAFSPYRQAQASHLQVLSAQWMPFVFFGLRRHLAGGGLGSLAGSGVALWAQNLSCGYYMIFFAPAAAAYAVFEILRRRLWTDWRLLGRMAALGILVAAGTWPFVHPYLVLRETEFPARGLGELRAFSADLEGYLSADDRLWIWGGLLRGFHSTQEGVVFQGLVPMVLAGVAVLLMAAKRLPRRSDEARPLWRRVAAAVAATVAIVNGAAVLVIATSGPLVQRAAGITLRVSRPGTALLRSAVAIGVLAWLLPGVRRSLMALCRTDTAFYAALAAAAVLLSFGPSVVSGGHVTIPSAPYGWLYENVPGFDGLRVPARFAMVVAFGLSVLAGIALAELQRRRRRGSLILAVAGALFLVEAGAAPIDLDQPLPPRAEGVATPPGPLYVEGGIPAVYAAVSDLPDGAVIVEFPLGTTAWDVRYMFYSLYHGRRLVNGFSGGVPLRYAADLAGLNRMAIDPDLAWSRLIGTGASHAVVHLSAYEEGGGTAVAAWLRSRGAQEIGRFETDLLFQLADH